MQLIRRTDDDEPLGYVAPVGPRFEPRTLFGAPLAAPTTRDEAEDVVRERGLSALAAPWWVETADGEWAEVRVQEVRPDRVRVRWADPMVDQPAHGHWVDPAVTPLRAHP